PVPRRTVADQRISARGAVVLLALGGLGIDQPTWRSAAWTWALAARAAARSSFYKAKLKQPVTNGRPADGAGNPGRNSPLPAGRNMSEPLPPGRAVSPQILARSRLGT